MGGTNHTKHTHTDTQATHPPTHTHTHTQTTRATHPHTHTPPHTGDSPTHPPTHTRATHPPTHTPTHRRLTHTPTHTHTHPHTQATHRCFCWEDLSRRDTTTPNTVAPTILQERSEVTRVASGDDSYSFPVTVATRRAPGRNAIMNLMLYWNGDSWNQSGTRRSEEGMR